MYLLSDQRFGRIVALLALDADALPQPLVPPAALGPLALPAGTCLDALHRLHIADPGNGRIVSFAFDTGAWTSFGDGAFPQVSDVAVDAQNRIYLVDGQRVLRVDDVDGSGQVELSGPASGRRPVAITVDRDGRLVIVDAASRGLLVSEDDGASWAPLGFPEGPEGPESRPVSVSPRRDGGVLVADLGGRRVVGFDGGGNASILIDSTDGLTSPIAAVEDEPGITVADAGPGWIRRYLPVDGRYVAADFVRGRRPDGTWRFDRVGGLTRGALS
jgi:DNA-binding beta-propeller fold protein YncE